MKRKAKVWQYNPFGPGGILVRAYTLEDGARAADLGEDFFRRYARPIKFYDGPVDYDATTEETKGNPGGDLGG